MSTVFTFYNKDINKKQSSIETNEDGDPDESYTTISTISEIEANLTPMLILLLIMKNGSEFHVKILERE
ncbi:hypothetical protein PAT3040_01697 [Paenibacillus agaridevorans]|uniref:Uncharacterized protein n=1 Tax=Paenibacillus agaridevorans TaxID=171404 RepID=A0A2R5ENB5_9BACL|nr:hypothetical protein PAT3040_01697 [Paenibacillus agaridevorans]